MTARIGSGKNVGPHECQDPLAEVDHEVSADLADFLAMHAEIHDNNVHEKLQHYLVELCFINWLCFFEYSNKKIRASFGGATGQ
jgi:hypothetical protein